jgi:hypothetical protein
MQFTQSVTQVPEHWNATLEEAKTFMGEARTLYCKVIAIWNHSIAQFVCRVLEEPLAIGGGGWDVNRRLCLQALSEPAASEPMKAAVARAWARMDNQGVRDAIDNPGIPLHVRLLLREAR